MSTSSPRLRQKRTPFIKRPRKRNKKTAKQTQLRLNQGTETILRVTASTGVIDQNKHGDLNVDRLNETPKTKTHETKKQPDEIFHNNT